jgi:hypothetical protein
MNTDTSIHSKSVLTAGGAFHESVPIGVIRGQNPAFPARKFARREKILAFAVQSAAGTG